MIEFQCWNVLRLSLLVSSMMQIDHKCVLDRCPAEKSSYCSGAITQRILSRRSPLFRCIDTDP